MAIRREIETNLEHVGEEFGLDSRALVNVPHTARASLQENEAGMVCEDENGNQHVFNFWIDPRTINE